MNKEDAIKENYRKTFYHGGLVISLEPCSTYGHCLLIAKKKDINQNLPVISVQLPTEFAMWIKNNLDKATDSPEDYFGKVVEKGDSFH